MKQPPARRGRGRAQLSACRRWQVVPPPAEHIRAATEALAPVAASSCEAEDALVHVDDLKVHFKTLARLPAPRPASHPRRRRRGPRRVRRPDARRRGRERLRQDDRGASHHRPHAAHRRRDPPQGQGRSSRARASARGRRCARSRWSSRTRTRRSTPRAAWATRSAARSTLLGGLGRQAARERAKELLRAVSLPESYFDRLPQRAERRREAARRHRARLRRRAPSSSSATSPSRRSTSRCRARS